MIGVFKNWPASTCRRPIRHCQKHRRAAAGARSSTDEYAEHVEREMTASTGTKYAGSNTAPKP